MNALKFMPPVGWQNTTLIIVSNNFYYYINWESGATSVQDLENPELNSFVELYDYAF